MRTRTPGRTVLRRATCACVALLCLLVAPAQAAPIDEHAPSADDRYTLAGGCFALRSAHSLNYVVKAGAGYAATATAVGAAEPFRMQATDLGRYLFYGPAEDFMARDAVTNRAVVANNPSDDSDWTVSEDAGAFRISVAGRGLVVGAGSALVTVTGNGGAAGLFRFEPLDVGRCADYPEVEVNVVGPLPEDRPDDAPVIGTVETHMHGMAFQFLGTKAHCGRPWHRFGAPSALVDCPDHGDTNDPNTEGCAAVLENIISGTRCHDTDGWPTFAGWPHHQQLTHEQSYYKWTERAWRAGMRIYVNLMVENRVLCEVYPLTPPPKDCNEMDSVRKQVAHIHEMERYIDAQWGGPGKGWYRIVESPEEAREVINDGKLAVVKGMEVSEPFNCRLMQVPGPDTPMCSESMVDDGIDELYHDLGIRQLEFVNKFDNALSGIAGDGGSTGTITNLGNFYSAGTFWDLEQCPPGPDDPSVNHDHSPTALSHNDDQLIANGLDIFGDQTGISLPVYGSGPHCNQRGFTTLGERALRRVMDKGMLFDPDHMSVFARNSALDIVAAESYPGVMTSHSWSTDNALPRISALGGLIGPAAKSAGGFVGDWRHVKSHGYDDLNPHLFGFGYGADMNGFASQGGPPPEGAQITYPFRSPIDPSVTVCQQQSGERTYDYNMVGTAHYGLYADWTEAVRVAAGEDGDEIIGDMANAAEAYLQMWERAEGISGGGETAPAPGPGGEPADCAAGGDGGGGGGAGGGGPGGGGGAGGSQAPGGAAGSCRDRTPTITGTPGDDRLQGTPANDVIDAGAGDDRVLGLKGDDVICGGEGDDKLLGNKGEDRLIGDDGDDTLKGGDDADVLKGNKDEDVLKGGKDDDRLFGGKGGDLFRGNSGDRDFCRGNPEKDKIEGSCEIVPIRLKLVR